MSKISERLKTECFKIQLFKTSDSNFWDITEMESIKQIHSLNYLKVNPVIIEADPFLFVNKGWLFLFYEEKKLNSNGVIMMIKTKDLYNWTKPVIALKESFHLSYPFVFMVNDDIYMIPESGETKSIRLYKAMDSKLEDFIYVCDLVSNNGGMDNVDIGFADSSIHRKDNMYYLNTTLNISGINHSMLYISEKLQGPYREHPASPVAVSNKIGRNGGSWISRTNRLFRIVQDCEKGYGEDVHGFQIDIIEPDKYEEHLERENILKGKDVFIKMVGTS